MNESTLSFESDLRISPKPVLAVLVVLGGMLYLAAEMLAHPWQTVDQAILLFLFLSALSSFGWMLGGIIIVENVFAYPGIGQLLLRSIETHDIPLLEVVTLIIAGTYAISNLLADLSYAALDPRVRLG